MKPPRVEVQVVSLRIGDLAAVVSVVGLLPLLACGPDSAAVIGEAGDDEGLEVSLAELNVDAMLAFPPERR